MLVGVLLTGPVLAACSGCSDDAVRTAATTFLGDWSAGKVPAAAGETTDAAAATTLLQQTAKDLPGATLTTRTGAVSVKGSAATVAWTATWHLAGAPDWSYGATLPLRKVGDAWKVVAQPTVVHPDLAAGQHLVLTRTLPPRAAVTDAAGAPLFSPTEVVNVGVDPGKVTDLPTLAAHPRRGHRRRPRPDHRRRPEGQGGPVRPGHHPAAGGLREDPRAGLRPARRALPDLHPAARPDLAVRAGPARPGRGRHRRGARRRPRTPPAGGSTRPGTSSACPASRAPTSSSSPAPPATR